MTTYVNYWKRPLEYPSCVDKLPGVIVVAVQKLVSSRDWPVWSLTISIGHLFIEGLGHISDRT